MKKSYDDLHLAPFRRNRGPWVWGHLSTGSGVEKANDWRAESDERKGGPQDYSKSTVIIAELPSQSRITNPRFALAIWSIILVTSRSGVESTDCCSKYDIRFTIFPLAEWKLCTPYEYHHTFTIIAGTNWSLIAPWAFVSIYMRHKHHSSPRSCRKGNHILGIFEIRI